MFGTLILQLPTEEGYTGGESVVRQYDVVKKFDCQLASSLGFCYIIFLAACQHALRNIKSGARLCLVFNLVDPSGVLLHQNFISEKVEKAEAAMDPWLKEVT